MKKHSGTVSEKKKVWKPFFKVSLERIKKLCDTFDSYGHLDYSLRYAPHKMSFIPGRITNPISVDFEAAH